MSLNGRTDNSVILLREGDDVAFAVVALRPNQEIQVNGTTIVVRQPVPQGHKVSLRAIEPREAVRKYGQIIGLAKKKIEPGSYVHTHNLAYEAFPRQYEVGVDIRKIDPLPTDSIRTFQGYLRSDGRVGTRNTVAVISTVNCSASVSKYVADAFGPEVMKAYPNVDGVLSITHKTGCGMAESLRDHRQLQRVLAGFARHPNAFDYVLIGLGCEINQTVDLIERTGLVSLGTEGRKPTVISIQESGGVRNTVDAGKRAVAEILPKANDVQRSEQPLSKLVLALECGGSDGYSGVTANPAVGLAVDELMRHAGTAILGETPEMYGAEHLLIRRMRKQEIADKLLAQIRWWEQYTDWFGGSINNNPTPGNQAGGLTTIFEKSLGAIAKAGFTPIEDVYEYAEPVTTRGLVLMDTPGYDPVSITGMVAGGANLIAFTTGRGSCFGCKPVPSLKVASNPELFRRMREDMDIDAGAVLEGARLDAVGRQIFEELVQVASGKQTKSEQQGIGEEEFAPWTIGPVM